MAKPKLTRAVRNAIIEGLELGMPIVRVIRSAGISTPTFYRWMQIGEEYAEEKFPPERVRKYVTFRKDVLAAEESLSRKALTTVKTILDKPDASDATKAKLATFMIERRMPESYGPRVDVRSESRVTHVVETPHEAALTRAKEQRLDAVLGSLLTDVESDVVEADVVEADAVEDDAEVDTAELADADGPEDEL